MSAPWAAFLGFVQGLAEFLPISSSGHLSVLQNLFGMDAGEEHLLFDVLLHLATFLAVCLAYRRDLGKMLGDSLDYFRGTGDYAARKRGRLPAATRLVLLLIVATLPLFLILPFHSRIEALYYNSFFIGLMFLLTGGMLYAADHMPPGTKKARTTRMLDALIVGFCQAVATIPGLSRSGATISAGMAVGMDRSFAVKFSFLLSLPAVLGANILSLADAIQTGGIELAMVPKYLLGMLVAFVTGYAAIALLRLIARKGYFGKFCYYCWGVGVVTILLSLIF